MNTKIWVLLLIYLIFIVANFGVTFAYLQRCDLTKINDCTTNCIYALVTSLPGFFGTISILILCRFPKYGWVFYYLNPEKENKLYNSIWN